MAPQTRPAAAAALATRRNAQRAARTRFHVTSCRLQVFSRRQAGHARAPMPAGSKTRAARTTPKSVEEEHMYRARAVRGSREGAGEMEALPDRCRPERGATHGTPQYATLRQRLKQVPLLHQEYRRCLRQSPHTRQTRLLPVLPSPLVVAENAMPHAQHVR